MPAGFTSARFVGRERELTQLAIALDQASVGRPTTVLVAGSSGIGVSRLLTEAQQRLAGMSEPFTVVRGEPRPRPWGAHTRWLSQHCSPSSRPLRMTIWPTLPDRRRLRWPGSYRGLRGGSRLSGSFRIDR